MAGPGDQPASLISSLIVLRLVTNFEVMACIIFIWDYILTFGMEVDLVWKLKWNFMKGLYLFQRYLPFVEPIWFIYAHQMGESPTESRCRSVYYADGVFVVVGLSASEMVLALRTWAVWNRNQNLSIILPILYSLCWGSSFVIVARFVNFVRFGAPPYPGFKGCFVTHYSGDIVFLWVLLLVWDTLLLTLMLVPAIQAYRDGGNTSLMKVVYRDGIIYYLYLFVLSSINIIVVKTLPQDYQLLLALLERMVHSILTSRVVLHIRAQAEDKFLWSDELTELNTIPVLA